MHIVRLLAHPLRSAEAISAQVLVLWEAQHNQYPQEPLMHRLTFTLMIAFSLALASAAQASHNASHGSSRRDGSAHHGRHQDVQLTSHRGDRDRHFDHHRFGRRQPGWTRHWLARYRCYGWWCPRTHCYYRWWAACGCYCPVDVCPPDLDDVDGPDSD
jgi:hypothetical protein